jgi:hypothetical protein
MVVRVVEACFRSPDRLEVVSCKLLDVSEWKTFQFAEMELAV